MSSEEIPLHGVIEGNGPPVLVLHGFTGCCESMAAISEGLRQEFRVLCLDLVGHGESPAPDDAAEYTMERCVEQIIAALDRHALRDVHVIGYSMGGRAALALAAWRPDRIRSAIVIGASAGLADADARSARRRDDETLADRIESEGLEAFVEAWMALPLFASQRRLGSVALAAARAQRLRNRPRALAHSLRGMGSGAQPSLHDILPSVRTPILAAHGTEDAKFAAIATRLAQALPLARVIGIPEAGHACHLEAPGAFLASAREFLTEQELIARESAAS